MLAKFAKSVEGGLGNSNEDEGRGSFPEVPMSAPASIYEKQQSWRMNSLSKVSSSFSFHLSSLNHPTRRHISN